MRKKRFFHMKRYVGKYYVSLSGYYGQMQYRLSKISTIGKEPNLVERRRKLKKDPLLMMFLHRYELVVFNEDDGTRIYQNRFIYQNKAKKDFYRTISKIKEETTYSSFPSRRRNRKEKDDNG